MEIQVHADHHVRGAGGLTAMVEDEVTEGLAAFADRITRVDVHLSDENVGTRAEADIRCLVEARPAGHEPVVVTRHAPTPLEATESASRQMHDLLVGMFGRLNADRHPGAETIRGH